LANVTVNTARGLAFLRLRHHNYYVHGYRALPNTNDMATVPHRTHLTASTIHTTVTVTAYASLGCHWGRYGVALAATCGMNFSSLGGPASGACSTLDVVDVVYLVGAPCGVCFWDANSLFSCGVFR